MLIFLVLCVVAFLVLVLILVFFSFLFVDFFLSFVWVFFCLRLVFCVPKFARVSELSILDCPVGFLKNNPHFIVHKPVQITFLSYEAHTITTINDNRNVDTILAGLVWLPKPPKNCSCNIKYTNGLFYIFHETCFNLLLHFCEIKNSQPVFII